MTNPIQIKADPEFVEILRKIKKDMDFESDRRTTKEIAKLLKDRKKQMII